MEEIMSIAVWIKNDTDKQIVEEFDCLYCQEGYVSGLVML